MAAKYHFVNSEEINNKSLTVTNIQRVTSGIFTIGRSVDNLGRAANAGTIFISIDSAGKATGDLRIHDGIKKSGISTPPPGTVAHMIPKKNSINPQVPIAGQAYGFDVSDGWLFCDGAILDKDKYQTLYLAIGDYWNTDPSLTSNQFQIPDLRGYFIRCYKGGPFGAASRQEDTVKKHSHYVGLNQSGGHTHKYINWKVNPLGNFTNPPEQGGVLNAPGLPGHNTRGVYALAKPPADMHSQIYGNPNAALDLVNATPDPETGWSESSFAPDPASNPANYIVLGEGFTRKMGTYGFNSGNWVQTQEKHEHYMKTLDSIVSDKFGNEIPNNPDSSEEGSSINIKIPTFIKF